MAKSKHRKPVRWTLIILFPLLLIIGLGAYLLLLQPNVKTKGFLLIPTGASIQQVKDSLQQNAFLSHPQYFDALQRVMEYTVIPGRYRLDKNLGTFGLVRRLKAGNQEPVKLILNNARTLKDLAKQLGRQFEPSSEAFLSSFYDSTLLQNSGLNPQTLISRFIPNTYLIWWNTSPQDLIARMIKEYHRFWNSERIAQAEQKGLSPLEVSIIASIVEEETQRHSEKPRVASVYLNRLRIGMPLQADPTVKFAVGDFSIRRIVGEHLANPSPYNTYRHRGLPPGPICMPGIRSIDAVLQAPKTNDLYFCAKSDFSGYHSFAATHAEHQRHAAAYRAALNRRDIH